MEKILLTRRLRDKMRELLNPIVEEARNWKNGLDKEIILRPAGIFRSAEYAVLQCNIGESKDNELVELLKNDWDGYGVSAKWVNRETWETIREMSKIINLPKFPAIRKITAFEAAIVDEDQETDYANYVYDLEGVK